MAQWLAWWTRDPAVAGSIPTTAHVVITLGKQFTYISSVHLSVKWVPGHRQLKCIDNLVISTLQVAILYCSEI